MASYAFKCNCTQKNSLGAGVNRSLIKVIIDKLCNKQADSLQWRHHHPS